MNSFKTVLFIMIFSSVWVISNGQVKIGSNPTTITSNKNLEVEATGGQKVSVNKDDGRTYVENKPAATSTDEVVFRSSTGELRKMSLDQLDALLDSPTRNPSAYVRIGIAPNKGVSGVKSMVGPSEKLLKGGFTINSAGGLVIPKDGVYELVWRPTTEQITQNPTRVQADVNLNGTLLTRLIMDPDTWHAWSTANSYLNDRMRIRHYEFNAGDVLTVSTTGESSLHFLGAFTLNCVYLSSKN